MTSQAEAAENRERQGRWNGPSTTGSEARSEAPHAHEDVARAHAYLRAHGLASEMKMEAGDPAELIVAEASAGGYDLVVVGSRGHGTLGRLFLGSVSADVVAHAPCPVLVAGVGTTERIESNPQPHD